MGKYMDNEAIKSECPHAKRLDCACAFCERIRGCYNCLECKNKGTYKIVNECDDQIMHC